VLRIIVTKVKVPRSTHRRGLEGTKLSGACHLVVIDSNGSYKDENKYKN